MQPWIRSSDLTFKKYLGQLKLPKVTGKWAAMGDCSLRPLLSHLESRGKLIKVEREKSPWIWKELFPHDKNFLPSSHGSAAWERVYTAYTVAQIMEYSLEDKIFDRVHQFKFKGRTLFADLARSRICYPSREIAEADIQHHARMSRETLKTAEVLFITLGMSETWLDHDRDLFLASYPKNLGDFKALEFCCSTVQDNIKKLETVCRIIKNHNRNVAIILSVSPSHFNATFRTDVDVFSAGSESKSVIRAAVGEICRKVSGVSYFPAFEIANIVSPAVGISAFTDGHHLSDGCIKMLAATLDCVME